MRSSPLTALAASLAGCHGCGLLVAVRPGAARARAHCPRCGARLHPRKPDSIARSWACLIAALILYVPANTFPIMTVTSFGRGSPDTILSGVIHLIEAEQWPIAALVFFASIFVPVLKITVLAFLLVSVQFKWSWRPRDRSKRSFRPWNGSRQAHLPR